MELRCGLLVPLSLALKSTEDAGAKAVNANHSITVDGTYQLQGAPCFPIFWSSGHGGHTVVLYAAHNSSSH